MARVWSDNERHDRLCTPEFLTSTEWLGDHLEDPGIRIVDCDVPDQYMRAHIPGAVFQEDHYQKDPATNRLHIFGPDGFKQLAESLGIGDDTLVIAYDNSRGLYAARLWWALHHYGHTQTSKSWTAAGASGSPKDDLSPTDPPGDAPGVTFTPRLNDSMMVTADRLMDDMNNPEVVVWDVRSRGEYEGNNHPRQSQTRAHRRRRTSGMAGAWSTDGHTCSSPPTKFAASWKPTA